jgi:hypothetical protein
VFVHGGVPDHFSGVRLTDTWELRQDNIWRLLNSSSPPLPLNVSEAVSIAFDQNIGRVLLFRLGDSAQDWQTWTWDGSAWTKLDSDPKPTASAGFHRMVFESSRGQMLLVGPFGTYVGP